MDNIKRRNLLLIIVVVSVSAIIIIITAGFVMKGKKNSTNSWIIKSYNNSVALYNGDKIVKIYDNIVLDVLPEQDKDLLNNGIAFTTEDEAVKALEDYDG